MSCVNVKGLAVAGRDVTVVIVVLFSPPVIGTHRATTALQCMTALQLCAAHVVLVAFGSNNAI